jgi:hypothetical protein
LGGEFADDEVGFVLGELAGAADFAADERGHDVGD